MTSRRRAAALDVTGFISGGVVTAGTQYTFAAFSDFQVVHAEAQAGVWTPDPPAACGPIGRYDGVVYGTSGDDVIDGGNHRQIIMGLGGNDVIHASNGGDCLVGGEGDDKLYGGNAPDILVGGDGNDYPDGGNGPDDTDGGAGDGDVCIGGHAPTTYVDCETQQ
jgi:Ca2+-binding RTX toxin-like protein